MPVGNYSIKTETSVKTIHKQASDSLLQISYQHAVCMSIRGYTNIKMLNGLSSMVVIPLVQSTPAIYYVVCLTCINIGACTHAKKPRARWTLQRQQGAPIGVVCGSSLGSSATTRHQKYPLMYEVFHILNGASFCGLLYQWEIALLLSP